MIALKMDCRKISYQWFFYCVCRVYKLILFEQTVETMFVNLCLIEIVVMSDLYNYSDIPNLGTRFCGKTFEHCGLAYICGCLVYFVISLMTN